jgi:hypothetical protein
MIRIILKILLIIFLPASFSFAADYPNIPNDIDIAKRSFCDKGGKKFGHTIVLLDITSKLDKAQIDFVRDQVFSNEFYLGRDPFTKFSYLLIDKKSPKEQEFSFSKCRPKSGNSTPKIESSSWRENEKILRKFYGDFKKDALKTHAEVYQTDFTSEYSFIYETVAYIFQSPKLDFSEKVGQRELIIVSDMMQHTKRLSFYSECNSKSVNAKCPTFETFMKNPSNKDYLDATAPKGKGVKLKIIYLNHRYETKKEIDKTLVELWKNYFIDRGFDKVEVVRQLDIRD